MTLEDKSSAALVILLLLVLTWCRCSQEAGSIITPPPVAVFPLPLASHLIFKFLGS
ncbi:hypothetical protein LguiA_020047 [Lonicera macranthoides]